MSGDEVSGDEVSGDEVSGDEVDTVRWAYTWIPVVPKRSPEVQTLDMEDPDTPVFRLRAETEAYPEQAISLKFTLNGEDG